MMGWWRGEGGEREGDKRRAVTKKGKSNGRVRTDSGSCKAITQTKALRHCRTSGTRPGRLPLLLA